MHKILLFFSLLLTSGIFSQSTQNIRGKIFDIDTKQPLIGAQIIVLGTDPINGAITNERGMYIISGVKVGRVSLKVSYVGYRDRIYSNVDIHMGKELVLEIGMEEKVYSAKEVEIIAKVNKERPKNDLATVSARTFSIDETNRYAGALGDPSRMAQNFAGVMGAGDSRNDIIIRGNSPMGLLWRLEGIDIPNPNHFGANGTTGGPVTILNNNLLNNSDFFTGAFPAEYGNALSGVFDLTLRNGNSKKHEFIGQVSFNGFELAAEGPFSKSYDGSYLVSYRYSTLALFDKIGLNAITGSSVPQYQDLTFKVNLPVKKGRFTLFGIGGLSYIQIYDSQKEEDEFSYGLSGTDTDFGSDMGMLGAEYVRFLSKKTVLKTNLIASGQRAYTYIDSLNDTKTEKYKFLRQSNNEVKYGVSSNLTHKFSTKNIIKAGISYDLYKVNFVDSIFLNTENRQIQRTNYSGNMSLVQAYTQFKHKFSDDLFVTLGLHSQYFGLNNQAVLEPRFGAEWVINKKNRISVGYGYHSQIQPKTIYFVETELPNGSSVMTNKSLGFTRSHHYVIGYNLAISNNVHFKTEAYLQNISNAPISPNIQTYSVLNEGANFNISLMDSLENKGTGQNYGVEFTLEKFMSNNFYFLATTSLFKSTYIGYNKVEHSTAFDNNYVVNALGGYEWKIGKRNKLTIDISGTYAGGSPYVPINIEQSAIDNETVYDWNNAYTERLADYFRINFKLGFRQNGKKISQEYAVDIQNITNHQNVFLQRWDSSQKKIVTDYQQGIFPMFLYRIYF